MRTFLCVAFSCVLISLCRGAAVTDVTATVDVAYVEGKPATTPVAGKTLIQTNADNYVTEIGTVATKTKKTPQIVVLPEYGLTGMNVDKNLAVKIDSDNCTKDSDELKGLYAIAKATKIILVANLLEKDDDDLYSTTIVIDGITPTEKLLAKYRKIHLKGGDVEKNLKSAGDLTSFKVKGIGEIGILSGDDILYENPVKKLKENGIKNFIYTSSQSVVLPFKSTVSLHAGFAKAHGVNLVVSSLSDIKNHISGSGIYTPCGPTKTFIEPDQSFVDIETVTLEPNTNCGSSVLKPIKIPRSFTAGQTLADLVDYNVTGLQSEVITANSKASHGVCDGDFCCNFTIASQNWNSETYRLVAKGGDERVCGIMICEDAANANKCGNLKTTPKTQFDTVTIYTNDEDTTFMPYILHSDLKPDSDWKSVAFSKETDKDPKGTTLTIKSAKDVIAIGIVSATKSAASSLGIAMNVLVISVFLKYLF